MKTRSAAAAVSVAARLGEVRRRVDAAALRAGRNPHEVTLIAVSRTIDVARVAAAAEAGQIDFGESRAQELRAKVPALSSRLRWHFVGRLQRNKVRDVLGVELIHSVDTLALAEAIAARARRHDRRQRVLVQVNVGQDPAKGGCDPDDAPDLVARMRTLDGIDCAGLMTIPAMGADPRPAFRRLRGLRDRLHADAPEIRHLSMGMSADFEAAVEEGATYVRVGEAVFGPRPPVQTDPYTPSQED